MTEAAQPMEDHVLVEVTVPAPADAVWAALRDPQKIKQWFGWDADTLKDEIDFIFVTHAQSEALGLSDRVVVMSNGVVEQIAPPRDLYRRPATPFVAEFIGSNTVIEGKSLGATTAGRAHPAQASPGAGMSRVDWSSAPGASATLRLPRSG